MSKLEKRAKTLAGETLHLISGRLNVIWRKWGTDDYPDDHGVGFRNELLLYADWLLYLFKQACSDSPEIHNEWLRKSASKLLELNSEEFMRCIGISRIYMQAFWWHMYFNQHEELLFFNEERVKQCMQAFGRELDWIFNVHAVQSDAGMAYHRLVYECIGNSEEYGEDSKNLLGQLLVGTQLGWSEAASPHGWDHWACEADLSAKNQLAEDPASAEQFCRRVFAQF